MRYRIIYGRTRRNYAGYTPDLPICIAAADTLDRCRLLMRQGIRYHLEALAEQGDVRPKPTGYLEILDFPPARSAAGTTDAKPTRRKASGPAVPKANPTRPRKKADPTRPSKKALAKTG